MKKLYSFFLAIMVLLPLTLFSANNAQNSQFAKYKPECLKIIALQKPYLKKLLIVSKQIKSKQDLLKHSKKLMKLMKEATFKSKGIFKILKQIPKNKRMAFGFWMISLDQEYTQLIIKTRNERQRIRKIPGCMPIINAMDKKIRNYRRSLR